MRSLNSILDLSVEELDSLNTDYDVDIVIQNKTATAETVLALVNRLVAEGNRVRVCRTVPKTLRYRERIDL